MNLADAIRKAALHPVEEATSVLVHTQPRPATYTQVPIREVQPEPLPQTKPIAVQEESQEKTMNPEPYEPTQDLTSGAAVRLELFLSPEQLSNLFRAVAANQHTMLTLREAASYLRVAQSALDAMAQEGDIPGFLIDGKWRFSKSAIDEWLTTQQHYRKESA